MIWRCLSRILKAHGTIGLNKELSEGAKGIFFGLPSFFITAYQLPKEGRIYERFLKKNH